MSTAIILGNGETRKELDLLKLKEANPDVPFFGCNALYRDFKPDYRLPDFLVAIDEGMIREIRSSDFPQERVIVPPENERWEPAECNPRRPRSNAGMNAMLEAIKRNHTKLVCFGFDFLITDPDLSTSNLYDGSPNYGPETRAVYADNFGRANFLNWIAIRNPHIDFIFAFPKEYSFHRFFSVNIMAVTFEKLLSDHT